MILSPKSNINKKLKLAQTTQLSPFKDQDDEEYQDVDEHTIAEQDLVFVEK